MLNDEERREILVQEAERARAEAWERGEAAQLLARETFRAQVRAAYRPHSPRWRWWLAGVLAWAAAAALFLYFRPAPLPEDTAGGISSVVFVQRCEGELLAQLGQLAAEFPGAQEAERQITASSDGKRWDGWVVSRPDFEGRAEFSCVYSPPTDSLEVQLIRP
ncbi:hypothetical protein [Deinococcus sp.]|uniref:hypothetical protein n=1 Tax=Deinococcus sp. TaxID=47478 RepID=UPI0025F3649E|nr:hypothetical protein [Deinococcus sp.]